MVTLHFSFYIKDYSNSMSHLESFSGRYHKGKLDWRTKLFALCSRKKHKQKKIKNLPCFSTIDLCQSRDILRHSGGTGGFCWGYNTTERDKGRKHCCMIIRFNRQAGVKATKWDETITRKSLRGRQGHGHCSFWGQQVGLPDLTSLLSTTYLDMQMILFTVFKSKTNKSGQF